MDEHFVQGVVGGVLNRHKGKTLDKKRIQTLMVEIAANIDVANQYINVKELSEKQLRNYNFIMSEMSEGEREHLRNWSQKSQADEKAYLDYWTCDYCNKNTHEIDYDYLSGTDHLECCLKAEALQEKSDKIMKTLDEKMKDFDLSKSESNENSKVDMTAKSKRGKNDR